jgi:type IV pilus assembly protein PilC
LGENYAYKVRDRAGKLVSGEIWGDNDAAVMQRLREMGYTPLKVGKKSRGLSLEISLRPGHVKKKDLAVFSRQFATMVNSGLPILRALNILASQTQSKALSKIITQVRMDVERGSSLSAAMAKHPKAFNNLYVAMIKSGETGGVLDQVLLRLADNTEKEVELRRRVKSAMTYPIVVLCVVSMVLVAMLVFIVPQFKSIYAQLHGSLPALTKLLMSISNSVRSMWYVWILGIAGLAFGFRAYKRTPKGRATVDKYKLKMPVFGPLFHKMALSRFANTLSVLLQSGVPILQSLDIVSETVNNHVVSEAVHDVQANVKEGETIAKPLARHQVFPPMVVQMLSVGEETGSVDVMLKKVGEFYDSEVTAQVDALTSLIEPLMIAVVGGMVGVAVIALYLPMFKLINLIK